MSSKGVSSIGSCMAFYAGVVAAETEAAYGAITFIHSGEATNIGDVGPENEVLTFTTVCDGIVSKRLGGTNYGQQAIELLYVGTNGAQLILETAAENKTPISVKESLSDGTIMYYRAYVASFKAQVGGSGDMLRAAVSLEIDSKITIVRP